MKKLPFVSCVMTTYRRFTVTQRSIKFFLDQDYKGKTELIIYNTDTEYPLELSDGLKKYRNIKIINNNTDYITNKDYDNVGSIRRDALKQASGEYYICWDDDDIFLPWNVRQCADGIIKYPDKWSWKPIYSLWCLSSEKGPEICGNAMEASIISRVDKVLEYGFKEHQGGGEHLGWYNKFQNFNKIIVDDNSIPAYSFNWSDTGVMSGHKQSGSIDRKDNFQYHKDHTKDFAIGKLNAYDRRKIKDIYKIYISKLREYVNKKVPNLNQVYTIKKELFDMYVKPHIR